MLQLVLVSPNMPSLQPWPALLSPTPTPGQEAVVLAVVSDQGAKGQSQIVDVPTFQVSLDTFLER